MQYAVTRDGTTLVTLHEGTDTTAIDAAVEQLRTSLEDGRSETWTVRDGHVYEHPAAPFDPYTVTVEFSVTVTVEAESETKAATAGQRAIDDLVSQAELESITFTSAPQPVAA